MNETLACAYCGREFPRPHNRGTIPSYCSAAHRQAAFRSRDRSRPHRHRLCVTHDAGGMGHVYSVTLDGVVVWSHAAIEGPWPPASDLLAALVSRGVYVDELSPEEPGFSPRSGPS